MAQQLSKWSHGITDQLILQNGKSSEVYSRNNNGPKTLPCCTPHTTLTNLLIIPSIMTCCEQFDRNSVNIDNKVSPIPTGQSWYRIPWWLTLSKAALQSIYTILASCSLSNALCSVCDTHKSASQVSKLFRRSNWVVGRKPLNKTSETKWHKALKHIRTSMFLTLTDAWPLSRFY